MNYIRPMDVTKLPDLVSLTVHCSRNGKAHWWYEFGVKASITTTNRGGFILGGMALAGTVENIGIRAGKCSTIGSCGYLKRGFQDRLISA